MIRWLLDRNLFTTDTAEQIEQVIEDSAKRMMNLKDIILTEINEWEGSSERQLMLIGERYYRNDTDILKRQRKVVGASGALEPVANLANNKLVNAFTRKLVNQKVGYLLSKQMSIRTDNENYQKELERRFDKKFMRLIQSLGTESINKGIAWLHVYYNDQGELSFMKIPSEQCIPIWRDAAHTELEAMIRYYQVEVYEGKEKKLYTKVEWWDTSGVRRYVMDGWNLIDDVEVGELAPHVLVEDGEGNKRGFNWERVPFIAFKYNDDELPLVKFIKNLVDDYDKQKSDNANNLEDLPNSIYVVKNYGDVDGATFRKNIAQYRVVFVEGDGGVDSVDIPINVEAYKSHMEQARKDIYEFGRGVDTQCERFGNASGVALKFLYADLDMDCNIIENEFQASLEQLKWFIDTDLANKGVGNFFDEEVEFIFNRDIIINETEAITNVRNSEGILSKETQVAQHPWVTNVQDELERMRQEREQALTELDSYRLPDDPRGQTDGADE